MNIKLFYLLILLLAIIGFGCGAENTRQSADDADPPRSAIGGSIAKDDDADSQNGEPNPSHDSDSSGKGDNQGTDSETDTSGDKIESIYTDLGEKQCQTIEENEEELWVVQECKGVAGYKLEVSEGDIRQSIRIIFPDGKKHELNFPGIVSPAFSYVGKKAEWRVVKEAGRTKPIALIVRFNASEDVNSDKETSYLTVTKITEISACVTDVVKPVKNQNVKARQLADSSANKPCLKVRKGN